MYGVGVATDDMTRALAIEALTICTRAADFLKEQHEEVVDDFDEER